MRLVNLYAGDEKNLSFAEDVAGLISHMNDIENSERWEAVEQIAQGISRITAAGGGRPLSADGIRGIQQLVCKVDIPWLSDYSFLLIRLLWFRPRLISWE
jgi:hypothetical protein